VPDALVLCYHAVSDDWPSPLAVSAAALSSQLEHLTRRGYRGVTFAEAAAAVHAGPVVAVTFDDAYLSVLERAAPILDRLGLPGTVFAPTAHVGRPGPMRWPGIGGWADTKHADELVCLDWDQLAALRRRGWEVGSHTCSHPRLSQLGDADLRRELADSREAIAARLGDCTSLALPYGDGDTRVAEAAEAVGYRAVAGLPAPGSRADAAWPRTGVYRADAMWRFRLKTGRATRRLRGSTAGAPLAALMPGRRP
jgi:peptidoglycan/xylan/chitin deacetylase (PgdA/CDA1 family)